MRNLLLPAGLWLSACSGYFGQASAPQTVPAALEHIRPPALAFANHELTDDSVVRVTTPFLACTGTLVAPDLVLTAHHCVARRSESGAYLKAEVPPENIHVELGGDFLPWGEIGIRAIVAPPCGYAAGVGDIAVLVLNRKLERVQIRAPALDTTPKLGAEVEPIGFGRCADSPQGVRRRARAGGKISSVKSSRFQLQAAVCPGDSGGPGLNTNGEIVGVVSASAFDDQQETPSRTEFTRVDRWWAVFAYAQLIAEGASPAELPPIAGCESADAATLQANDPAFQTD